MNGEMKRYYYRSDYVIIILFSDVLYIVNIIYIYIYIYILSTCNTYCNRYQQTSWYGCYHDIQYTCTIMLTHTSDIWCTGGCCDKSITTPIITRRFRTVTVQHREKPGVQLQYTYINIQIMMNCFTLSG